MTILEHSQECSQKKTMTQREEEWIEHWELWVVFSLTIDLTSEQVT